MITLFMVSGQSGWFKLVFDLSLAYQFRSCYVWRIFNAAIHMRQVCQGLWVICWETEVVNYFCSLVAYFSVTIKNLVPPTKNQL